MGKSVARDVWDAKIKFASTENNSEKVLSLLKASPHRKHRNRLGHISRMAEVMQTVKEQQNAE